MSTTDTAYRPTRGDTLGIWIFMVAGAAIVAWGAIVAIGRITEVVNGERITATARFRHLEVQAPIGPGGSSVPLQVDAATVVTDHLSPAGFGAAIVAAILGFAVVATVVTCLMLLARNSLRGRIFSRSNTRLLTAAGMTALVGFGIVPAFDGMVANDAVSKLAAGGFDRYAVFVAEPLPFILLAFAFAIVATAYTIGARLQKDAEGLV